MVVQSWWLSMSITDNRECAAEERLPPVHPGKVLLENFMKPLGFSQYRLAQDLGVPALRISQIVHGKRAVTADTALRLARYFGTSPHVWMRLQARYDLEVAEVALAERVKREVKVRQLPVLEAV
jgi:antitoxin HigA-1